jgi:hypothetical protein
MNNPPQSKKLASSSSYVRPAKTKTELTQTKKEIEDKLKNFEEVPSEDVPYITLNSQVRYISYDQKNKKELFRYGGVLKKMDKEYVLLGGKDNLIFSVQRYTKDIDGNILHTTRFFRKMKEADLLKEELDETIEKSTELIKRQDEIIDKQKKELMALKKKLGKA